MYHISAAVGSSCVQGTVFCDDVGSHLVQIWSAAGSPTAGGREQGSGPDGRTISGDVTAEVTDGKWEGESPAFHPQQHRTRDALFPSYPKY